MESSYIEVFDTKDNLRCVLLDTGEAAVVDEKGSILLRIDRCKNMEFADHGFVKVKTSIKEAMRDPKTKNLLTKSSEGRVIHTTYYVDMKSGHPYGDLPDIERYGDFEIANIGGYLCMRTKQYYQVKSKPENIEQGNNGLFLEIPCYDAPKASLVSKMIKKNTVFRRCQIRGDEDKLYWKVQDFMDGSVAVMDDKGIHYHVRRDTETSEVQWRNLGQKSSEAARAMMLRDLNEIEKESIARKEAARKQNQEAKEQQRLDMLKTLTQAEPVEIGGKWGLRIGGRITVPTIYRTIESPKGYYSVMEASYGCWGVVAVDGRVEIEPRYEKVVLHEDGMAELTVFKGKVITKKLGN